MARTTYHHGNLRQTLVEAALQLALERGPEGVSVREAARIAGVSSGAPFRHFPSRRALMTAVAEEATERLRIEVRRAIRPSDRTAHKRLAALGRGYLRWARDHPAHFRIVSARDQIDLAGSPGLQRGMQVVREQTEQTIREAQAEGSIAAAHDAAQLALLSRACVYGLARMRLDGHLPQWGVEEGEESQAVEGALALLIGLMHVHGEAVVTREPSPAARANTADPE